MRKQEYIDPVVEDYKKRSPIEMDNNDIKRVFSKYKVITYVAIILFPPYALYRIVCKNSQFQIEEKFGYVFICIALMSVYIFSWL